jgi:hypothetical protein
MGLREGGDGPELALGREAAALEPAPLIGDSWGVNEAAHRRVQAFGGAVVLILAGYIALIGGGILLLVAIVGTCAAVLGLLYGVADLSVYLFGFSFRWGLVTACGLLFVGTAVGGLIHDLRLEVMPSEPDERQTVDSPSS